MGVGEVVRLDHVVAVSARLQEQVFPLPRREPRVMDARAEKHFIRGGGRGNRIERKNKKKKKKEEEDEEKAKEEEEAAKEGGGGGEEGEAGEGEEEEEESTA